MNEAIERSKYDVGISHIYIIASKGVGAEKIEEGRLKIEQAYQALEIGKSWETVAKSFSEDNYTKDKAGYLGYYTALQIAHYSLENAAYNE